METEPSGTKLALMMAAGELFAEHGLQGASVRAIADKAGANIAAINYYFGSKENLYREVLGYVAAEDEGAGAPEVLREAQALETPVEFARLISHLVRLRFETYFSPEQPMWRGKLVLRSFIEPSPALEDILHSRFKPDHDALVGILRCVRPDLSNEDCELFAYSFVGLISFYMLARTPILMHMGKEQYDPEFLDAAARHVARVLMAGLGLPILPEESGVETAISNEVPHENG